MVRAEHLWETTARVITIGEHAIAIQQQQQRSNSWVDKMYM